MGRNGAVLYDVWCGSCRLHALGVLVLIACSSSTSDTSAAECLFTSQTPTLDLLHILHGSRMTKII